MFIERIRARRAIESNFAAIGYRPGAETWQELNLAVARDIQARQLPPNVPVPSRRRPVSFVSTVYGATGSARVALTALFRAGSWTSSGGSFRLAEAIGIDVLTLVADGIERGGFTLLEIGGAWAGFHPRQVDAASLSLAQLARQHRPELGRRLRLHFTNLTQWHQSLPVGVTEHPFVTAAGLSITAARGIEPASVDLVYSQAAAYFEPDIRSFVEAASGLLRPGGLLAFNYPPEVDPEIRLAASIYELDLTRSTLLGGMNGRVALLTKRGITLPRASERSTVAPAPTLTHSAA